jgi:hypothetical protein
LKFNDEIVTRVDKAEVLGDMTGSNANPYLLVYVKKDEHMVRTHMRRARETIQEQGHDQAAAAQAEMRMSVDSQPLANSEAPRDEHHQVVNATSADVPHV